MMLEGLIWFVLTLLPLALLQRLLHREMQAVLLILSRSPAFTIAMFSIIFLPGVLLHEFSHYLVAVLLGVGTARFSLVPQMLPEGRLQLGYVETVKTDIVRDSLIGAAPLFAGGSVVAYLAVTRLDLLPLWEVFRSGQLSLFWLGVTLLPKIKDFPLWFYLIFTVSSTMLPSRSDRHAWLPLGVAVAVLLGLAIVAGAGPWMLDHLAPLLNDFLQGSAVILGLSALLHAALILPMGLMHILLARITGVDVK
ncbi:MAG TPA: hypothetical protein VHM28_09360 [Anaerolineales bacterium]|nr:hypothetical protein [Anaerolineales bacterium]